MRLFKNDDIIVYTNNVTNEEYKRRIITPQKVVYDDYGTVIDDNMTYYVKYFDEITESILSEFFKVKKCDKKHIWYGEWENHRRIAVKLYYFYSHEIRFGYNYDFIPILNRQDKFVYHRTDKAVNLDVMDYYINHIDYDEDKLTHLESYYIRKKYDLPEFGNRNEIEFAKNYIRDVVRTNIQFMQDFYARYSSDEEVIEFLDFTIKYGNQFEKHNYIWTKAFLFARLHNMEKAIETMQEYYARCGGEIPEKVMKKLNYVNENIV